MTADTATDTEPRSLPSGSSTACVLDEDTRRYYLEVMGVQCWQSLEPEDVQAEECPAEATPDKALQYNSQPVDSSQAEHAVAEAAVSVSPAPQSPTAGKPVPQSAASDTSVPESLAIDWPSLEQSIQQCDLCQLHGSRKQAIVGRGDPSADLMFVLLAPVKQDDEAGQICSGEADTLLTRMLAAIGIDIQNVYITSLLKCCVPQNHTVSPREISLCNEHLKQQVALVQPKRVIVLGEVAIQCLLQKPQSIDSFRTEINTAKETAADLYSPGQNPHGFNQPSADPAIANPLGTVPLFVTYSPHDLLHNTALKRSAWSDLQQLQKLI